MIVDRTRYRLIAVVFSVVLAAVAHGARAGCSPQDSAQGGDIDVFLIAGQSNATGIPDDAKSSPNVPEGSALQYYQGRVTTANDPVGNAFHGSAWPAFGIAYHQLTGRRALFVPASAPASSMVAKADFFKAGHWDRKGKLFDGATSAADAALRSAGPQARFAGILWDQGEFDAIAIGLSLETPAEYKATTEDMIGRFRSHFGATTPFFIFETGTIPSKPQGGFEAVRAAQQAMSLEMTDSPIVFNDAVTFPDRRLMSNGGVHYSQAGYNIMGQEGASAVAAYRRLHNPEMCR